MPSALTHAFHRHVWQKLPQKARRDALFWASALLAPRPDPTPPPGGPIIIAGTFRAASGLGESARLCRDALRAAGRDVYAVDLTDALMQTADAAAFAGRLDAAPMGAGTLILHVNAPLVPLALRAIGSKALRGKRVFGYWAWELPDLPADWRFGLPFVHGVLAPSRFTARAVAAATSVPVAVLPHPIAVRAIPADDASERGDGFTVLTIFNATSSFARKNPEGAVAAFRLAFGDDPAARLLVKLSNPDAFPPGTARLRRLAEEARNVTLIDGIATPAGMDALYGKADAVLSLHRSEGFGLTVAEAMLRGIPAVSTDWSGSTDFFEAAHGFPVPWRPVPARDPQGTYDHPGMRWAEPDIEAAAAALRNLRGSLELRRRFGEAARRDALRLFGVEAYVAALDAALSPS